MYIFTEPEICSDLTAGVESSFVLAGEGVVLEIVEPQSGVVCRHQDLWSRDSHMRSGDSHVTSSVYLFFSWEGLDPADLSTSVLPVSGLYMYLCVVLQMLQKIDF